MNKKLYSRLFLPPYFLLILGYLFASEWDRSGIINEFRDFYVLFFLYFFLSFLAFFKGLKFFIPVFFLLKIVFISVMGLLFFPENPMLFSFLYLMYFWDLNVTYSFPAGLFYSLCSCLISGYIIFFLSVNGQVNIDFRNNNVIASFVFSFLAVVFSITFTNIISKMQRQKEIIKSLHLTISDLSRTGVYFLNYASAIKHQTIMKERHELTSEIHDVLGHPLTNIISMMDVLQKNPLTEESEQRKLNQWIRDQAQLCLKNTRSVLYRLRDLEKEGITETNMLVNLFKTFSFTTKMKLIVNGEMSNGIFLMI
ncbi:histidine kinase dimerization/phosphoacceptor domain-containing protein [Treponema sp. OttesenSCG-928-L16]|nr:histidine kinase dimerization/phosphoacceptor domain-containing protein [Treponema sp. OttesenSCG-928-L16]